MKGVKKVKDMEEVEKVKDVYLFSSLKRCRPQVELLRYTHPARKGDAPYGDERLPVKLRGARRRQRFTSES